MLCLMFQLTTNNKFFLSNELLIKEQPRAYVTHFRNGNFNVIMEKDFVLS